MFLEERQKLKLVKYNKSFQNNINISILNYQHYKGCYIKCPSYTKENKALNTCDCLYGWNYDEKKGDILCYDNKEYCDMSKLFRSWD